MPGNGPYNPRNSEDGMHRVGEDVEDDKAILFRHGDLGVGKDFYYIRKYGLFSRCEERGTILTSRDDS